MLTNFEDGLNFEIMDPVVEELLTLSNFDPIPQNISEVQYLEILREKVLQLNEFSKTYSGDERYAGVSEKYLLSFFDHLEDDHPRRYDQLANGYNTRQINDFSRAGLKLLEKEYGVIDEPEYETFYGLGMYSLRRKYYKSSNVLVRFEEIEIYCDNELIRIIWMGNTIQKYGNRPFFRLS